MPVGESAAKGSLGPLRVVIAGGGVAALETMLALRALAGERVAVKLIAPEPQFWYRPLSVLTPFGGGRVQPLELTDLARDGGAEFELGAVASVDAASHLVRTATGTAHEYDALVIACGVRLRDSLPGAFTFRGPGDAAAVSGLLAEMESGGPVRLVFAVPPETTWPLPLYELVLLTAAHFAARPESQVEIALVTPEEKPLALFGAEASASIARLLDQRGVTVHLKQSPLSLDGGTLRLSPTGSLPADHVIALPRIEGRPIPGVPFDGAGFIPTDEHGRVAGLGDVYAAGDGTAFPVKQGGLATQQADAVAETIAAATGAPVTPQPFRPILRGLLLTGGEPGVGGSGSDEDVTTEGLWWPPGKIVGHYLAPFLAERADTVIVPLTEIPEGLPIEVAL